MTGTHRGELRGIASAGRGIRIEGSTFATLDQDGLVMEDMHFTHITSTNRAASRSAHSRIRGEADLATNAVVS